MLSIYTLINTPVGAVLDPTLKSKYQAIRQKSDVTSLLKECGNFKGGVCNKAYDDVTKILQKNQFDDKDKKNIVSEFNRLLKKYHNKRLHLSDDELKTLIDVKKVINEGTFLSDWKWTNSDVKNVWHTLYLKNLKNFSNVGQDTYNINMPVDPKIAEATLYDVAQAINEVYSNTDKKEEKQQWLNIFGGQSKDHKQTQSKDHTQTQFNFADFKKAIAPKQKSQENLAPASDTSTALNSETKEMLPQVVKNKVAENLQKKKNFINKKSLLSTDT